MKTVTITCDMCEKELIGEHIEIGAQNDGYLQYKNTLAHRGGRQLASIDNPTKARSKHHNSNLK